MRVYVDIENGGDLHNFVMKYAENHDMRMRDAYAALIERGRETIETDADESIDDVIDEEGDSPLNSDEEGFARDLVEVKPTGEPVDEHFEDFHETVRERARASDAVADGISPVLLRWYIVHYL